MCPNLKAELILLSLSIIRMLLSRSIERSIERGPSFLNVSGHVICMHPFQQLSLQSCPLKETSACSLELREVAARALCNGIHRTKDEAPFDNFFFPFASRKSLNCASRPSLSSEGIRVGEHAINIRSRILT